MAPPEELLKIQTTGALQLSRLLSRAPWPRRRDAHPRQGGRERDGPSLSLTFLLCQ